MPSYVLEISYHGGAFRGSQRQGTARTVEKVMMDACRSAFGEDPDLLFASRTDAGVHALGNVVRMRLWREIDPARGASRLNHLLPEDVAVVSMRRAADGFNPRRDARWKQYRYHIWNVRCRPVLDADRVWHVREPLDVNAMRRAARLFTACRDFRFATTREYAESGRETRCRLKRLSVIRCGGCIVCTLIGNRFLHRMVRYLVGMLVDAGAGRLAPHQAEALTRRPFCARRPAPAHGLVLERIVYGTPHGGEPASGGTNVSWRFTNEDGRDDQEAVHGR